ncbi:hypothetical protein HPB50_008608 [Hyalomma asiaticum]|uniref:Uncharacterized protein n=1 Tax=Hyalomma asiaticum TaxID=266040 RepID=A0ACB7S4U1_HYAAI|nr:hypothetical protein HPB50_008608 [Hyalomma asiaticum]
MVSAGPHIAHRRAKRSNSTGLGLPLYACALLSGSITLAAIVAVLVLPELVRALREQQREGQVVTASTASPMSSSGSGKRRSGVVVANVEDAMPKVADGSPQVEYAAGDDVDVETTKLPSDADRFRSHPNESSSPASDARPLFV